MARSKPDPDGVAATPDTATPENSGPDTGSSALDATQPVTATPAPAPAPTLPPAPPVALDVTAAPAPAPSPETVPRAHESATSSSGGKRRVRRAVGWLVRGTAVVVVVVAIGAGIYFGWPVVYDRYLAPVQTNTADVVALRSQVADLQGQVDDLVAADSATDARLASIDGRLAELDAMDATLASNDAATAAEIARQVQLLKGMELMSRARLFMFQANYGLAEQDVQAARDILAGVGDGASSDEAASITVAVVRLDRVLTALPNFPVAARDDLDIAWLALLGRVPTESPATGDGASPEPSSEPSPTAAP